METFDQLLASDAEIREKRHTDSKDTKALDLTLRVAMAEGRIAAEKEVQPKAPTIDSDWWMHDAPTAR